LLEDVYGRLVTRTRPSTQDLGRRINAPAGFTWWQAGAIYQIYPRSYADTNADGVGDLPGIARRLDHLQHLGVDTVWLSPIYPSPMVDLGYDITNHTEVDPLFGDLLDFDALVAGAHQRGLRVLMDFIPNHLRPAPLVHRRARLARTRTGTGTCGPSPLPMAVRRITGARSPAGRPGAWTMGPGSATTTPTCRSSPT